MIFFKKKMEEIIILFGQAYEYALLVVIDSKLWIIDLDKLRSFVQSIIHNLCYTLTISLLLLDF